MKYEKWLKQLRESESKAVQLRMMSSGNDLVAGLSLKYGIYLAQEESDDQLTQIRGASSYSSGRGAIPSADIEFFVRPLSVGHLITRQHGEEIYDRNNVGFSFSLKGADKVAYNLARKTGSKVAKLLDVRFIDQTSRDLSIFSDRDYLELKKRVHNYETRVRA